MAAFVNLGRSRPPATRLASRVLPVSQELPGVRPRPTPKSKLVSPSVNEIFERLREEVGVDLPPIRTFKAF
jgi:hypothetical protein